MDSAEFETDGSLFAWGDLILQTGECNFLIAMRIKGPYAVIFVWCETVREKLNILITKNECEFNFMLFGFYVLFQ
jgi:hypothetical protein